MDYDGNQHDVERAEPDENRRGFALPAAIGAIVIIGVLVTTGFYMAQQEVRMGVATENAGMAFFLAERGASEVLDNWDNSVMEALTLFDPATITGTIDEGAWSVDVRRTGTQQYFLTSTGVITEGGALNAGATRTIGMVARHLGLGIDPPAAITTMGGVDFAGLPPNVVGDDTDPPSWANLSCPAGPPVDQPGLISDDTTGTISGTSTMGVDDSCYGYFVGSPNCVDEDIPVVNQTFEPFYDAEYWAYLIDIASHELASASTFSPSYTGGACDYDDPNNWGEPLNPTGDACGDYFPLIYVSGDVIVNGNSRGQGILLVEGDVSLAGTVDFNGIIISKGDFSAGGGVTIYGSIISETVSVLNGTPDIFFSDCAVEAAINLNPNVARARPLTRRSFVDLTNLGN
jgi:hypothetical protein